jgi:hypothetical protein
VRRQKAAAGGAAGEASLVHVALASRPGSIVLSNDPHGVGLGRRSGVTVRGTLYVMHRAFSTSLLDTEEAWMHYRSLQNAERRPSQLASNSSINICKLARIPGTSNLPIPKRRCCASSSGCSC